MFVRKRYRVPVEEQCRSIEEYITISSLNAINFLHLPFEEKLDKIFQVDPISWIEFVSKMLDTTLQN